MNARPEITDLFGLRHRPGCPANAVVTRRAVVRPGYYYTRCETCGAIATVKANGVDASGEEVETS